MDEIDAATKSWRKWVLGRGKGSTQEAGKVKTLILYALNWWEQVKNGGRATSWEVNGEVVVLEREEKVLAWTRAKTQDEGKWSGQIYLGGSSNRTRWIGGEGQESRWLLVSDFSNGMVEPLQKKIRKKSRTCSWASTSTQIFNSSNNVASRFLDLTSSDHCFHLTSASHSPLRVLKNTELSPKSDHPSYPSSSATQI